MSGPGLGVGATAAPGRHRGRGGGRGGRRLLRAGLQLLLLLRLLLLLLLGTIHPQAVAVFVLLLHKVSEVLGLTNIVRFIQIDVEL